MSGRFDDWFAGLSAPGRPDEFEVKALLARCGIATPRGVRFAPGEPFAAPDFDGPYVAKVCSGEILHKTDQGGVVLHLDRATLPGAVDALRERFPGAGVLVEEMVRFSGTEFIVGALVDAAFGPAVMVGAGGILTELYRDVTFRLAPLDVTEAGRMLDELTVSPVLRGFRNLGLDREGLAETIAAVGELVVELGERFGQLDLNPLVYTGERWVALDGKLVLR